MSISGGKSGDGGQIITQQGRRVNHAFGPAPPYIVALQAVSPQGCRSEAASISISALPGIAIEGPPRTCPQAVETYSVASFPQVDYAWSISPPDAGTIISSPQAPEVEIYWHRSGPALLNVTACWRTATYAVEVGTPPLLPLEHPEAVCPGDSGIVQLALAAASHAWYDQQGNLLSTAPDPQLPAGRYRLEAASAEGCINDTSFQIRSFEAPSIYITTPDPNRTLLCGQLPNTRLYASDTESGLTFQWLHDGNPVGTGEDGYVIAAFGPHQVQVTDQNGCQALSNVIEIYDCDSDLGGLRNRQRGARLRPEHRHR
jgi:hypothetical protein